MPASTTPDHFPEQTCRLLIPVDASERSLWPLRYALRLRAAGRPVETCLLYLGEPVHAWEVLRFHSEAEIRQRFLERSAIFLAAAAEPLQAAGIACRTYYREAEAVEGILDAAEELACTEIAVPCPPWSDWFGQSLAARLRRRQDRLPVSQVDAAGTTH